MSTNCILQEIGFDQMGDEGIVMQGNLHYIDRWINPEDGYGTPVPVKAFNV